MYMFIKQGKTEHKNDTGIAQQWKSSRPQEIHFRQKSILSEEILNHKVMINIFIHKTLRNQEK